MNRLKSQRGIINRLSVNGYQLNGKRVMNSFEELECWKLAADLRKEVSKLIKTFPAEEKFRLMDQMKRCSRSVTNDIAEGFGRFHYQENIHFAGIAEDL